MRAHHAKDEDAVGQGASFLSSSDQVSFRKLPSLASDHVSLFSSPAYSTPCWHRAKGKAVTELSFPILCPFEEYCPLIHSFIHLPGLCLSHFAQYYVWTLVGGRDIKILLHTYSFGSHCWPTWGLLFKLVAVRKSGDFTQKYIFEASLKKLENQITTDLQTW